MRRFDAVSWPMILILVGRVPPCERGSSKLVVHQSPFQELCLHPSLLRYHVHTKCKKTRVLQPRHKMAYHQVYGHNRCQIAGGQGHDAHARRNEYHAYQ